MPVRGFYTICCLMMTRVLLRPVKSCSARNGSPDHGMVIERDPDKDETTVHISKVCFEQTGYRGTIRMRFDKDAQRFHRLDDMQGELWT